VETLNKLMKTIWLSIACGLIALAFVRATEAQPNKPSKNQIEAMIFQSAVKNGVDPNLALAIATIESGLNPNAVGSLGELGVFQLRPNFHPVIKGDVRNNIDVATKYLARLQKQCSRMGSAFFVCYNHGPYSKVQYPKKTKYYAKVTKELSRRNSIFLASK
jgi:soluble lytic murein transglycosylase-like protein